MKVTRLAIPDVVLLEPDVFSKFGKVPDIGEWGMMLAVGVLIAWAGFAWFQKTRKGFANVL